MAGIGTFALSAGQTRIITKGSSIQAIAIEVTAGTVTITGGLGLSWTDGGSEIYTASEAITISASGNKYVKFASSTGAIEYLKIVVAAGSSCNVITENFV